MFAVAPPAAAAGAPSLAPRVSVPHGRRVSGASPVTSAVPRSRRTARRAVDTATPPKDEEPAVDAPASTPALATDDGELPSGRAGAPASSSPAPAAPRAAGENTFVQSIARQGRGESRGVTLDDLLAAETGGPPRFFSPIPSGSESGRRGEHGVTRKPSMVYVPGLDGTGFAASAQFERLSEDFNLSCLNVPVGDRSGFDELVEIVCAYLETIERDETATTTLLGESMGGLIALGVALRRPDLVRALVLVNPASSFDRSPWPALGPALPLLPEQLYQGLPYALAPVLFDPPRLLEGAVRAAAAAADAGAAADANPLATPAGLAAAAEELASLFPALGQLSSIIPRDTLAHRLNVLKEGCATVNAQGALERFGATPTTESTDSTNEGGARRERASRSPPLRALAIVSDADALIPSADEGARLKKRMPRGSCVVETLEGASHAALQEAGVDLAEILRANGFAPRRPTDPKPLSRDAAFVQPSAKELDAAFRGLDALRSIASPVFFSTREEDGSIVPGLSAVPFEDDTPVLLVGNHQTIAPDLGFIIEAFIKQRGVLPRGLAHPVVAGGGGFGGGASPPREKKKNETDATHLEMPFGLPAPPGALELATQVRGVFDAAATAARDAAPDANASPTGGGGGGGLSQFSAFGAVPVSGKNLYRLLAAGECVLLFPGGVREAFKRKDEKYALFWPSRPEFVRMAARHKAIIVPFAAVGAEDGFEVVADADDVKNLPFGVGDALLARAREVPSARAVDTRVTQDGQAEEAFVQPLIVPRAPERYYFKFGKPIRTERLFDDGVSSRSVSREDREAEEARLARETYDECRASVEDGIDWLLARRSEDPFGDTPSRVIWEAAAGKQAPTFTP